MRGFLIWDEDEKRIGSVTFNKDSEVKNVTFDYKMEIVKANVLFTYDNLAGFKYKEIIAGKNNFKVLEETGLKDRNGRGIYTGGIVKIIGYCSKYFDNDIAQVVFENGAYMLKSVNKKEDVKEHFKKTHVLEVIGSIYENPELIRD